MQQRNQLIDLAKGFAIVLVVLGHAIQYNRPNDFDANIIFKGIYAFHMPLFMFLSGYVAFGHFQGELSKFVKRLKTLMIPFFSWFLIGYLLLYVLAVVKHEGHTSFVDALLTVVTYPDHGLWFLWVLLLNYFLLFISLRITKKYEVILLFMFVLLLNVELEYFNFHQYGIRLTSWHLLFFTTGYVFSKYAMLMSRTFRYIGWISLCLFPLLLIFWSRTSAPAFVYQLSDQHGIQTAAAYGFNAMVGLTGILAILYLLNVYLNLSLLFSDQLIRLGTLTLEIYTTHMIFLPYLVLFTPFFAVNVIITFLLAIGIAYLLQGWLKKVKLFGVLFYGK